MQRQLLILTQSWHQQRECVYVHATDCKGIHILTCLHMRGRTFDRKLGQIGSSILPSQKLELLWRLLLNHSGIVSRSQVVRVEHPGHWHALDGSAAAFHLQRRSTKF